MDSAEVDFSERTRHIRRARGCVEQWNANNPGGEVAWETVEEVILALERASAGGDEDWSSSDYLCRALDFKRRLPAALIEAIWPGGRIS